MNMSPIFKGSNSPAQVKSEDVNLSLDDIRQSGIQISNSENTCQPLFEDFLDRGKTVVINADNGSGSTWVAAELAIKSAAGQPLFNHYPFVPPAKDFEDIVFLFSTGILPDTLNKRNSKMISSSFSGYQNLYVLSKEAHTNTKPIFDLNDPNWYNNLNNVVKNITDKNITDKNIIMIFDNIDLLCTTDSSKKNTNQIKEFNNFIKESHFNPRVTQIWFDKNSNKSFSIPYHFIDLKLKLIFREDRGNLTIAVEFLKSNSLKKDKTQPFILELKHFDDEPAIRLELKAAEVDREDIAAVMMIDGFTQNEIAQHLNVSQSTISTFRAKAIQRGLIDIKGKNNIATEKGNKLVKSIGTYI